jgi:plastocyanin
MRIRGLFIIAAATALIVTGCGSGESAIPMSEQDSATTAPAAAAGVDLTDVEFTDLTGKDEVTVVARDNSFAPEYIEVSAGTEVLFDNKGEQGHNVIPATEGAFTPIDTGDFEPGDSGTVTFTEPGDYSYYCSLHGTATKGMTGAIRVLGE